MGLALGKLWWPRRDAVISWWERWVARVSSLAVGWWHGQGGCMVTVVAFSDTTASCALLRIAHFCCYNCALCTSSYCCPVPAGLRCVLNNLSQIINGFQLIEIPPSSCHKTRCFGDSVLQYQVQAADKSLHWLNCTKGQPSVLCVTLY